jgi:Putative esterase
MKIFNYFTFFLFVISLVSCSDNANEEYQEQPITPGTTGTGFFNYSSYAPLASKPVKIFYHIPSNTNQNTPILFLFHGDDRNASQYRDALINKSNQKGFIVIAPEFSEQNYPTGDQYNLGNVFIDGDNPSPNTLNPEDKWTFSIIEPLFDYVKTQLSNNSNSYQIIGHSAGAQFAHRFMMFKPNARFDKIVASASGWYTMPENNVVFPYGFNSSPLQNSSLSTLFGKKLFIQIGSNDNNPNASGLRRNPQADVQGTNRLARANYFFNTSKNIALTHNNNFQWQLKIVSGIDHDFIPAINNAVDLIF